MLHLFDKVYIVSDKFININVDRVVISQENGFGMYEELDKVSGGNLIAFGTSVDAILENSDFPTFIQTLKNKTQETNKKVVIYADDASFSKFLSTWFKSIFVNISIDDAWLILSSYVAKEQFMKNSRSINWTTQEAIHPLLSQEQFSVDFLSATGHTLEDISQKLSIELLLANYISVGTHKSELKSSIKTILNRALIDTAIEIKYSFIKNHNKPNYPSVAKDIEFFTNSTIYTDTALGSVNTHSNITNLETASDSDIIKFKNISTEILLAWEQQQPGSAIFSLIEFIDMIRQSELSDSDLDELINFERSTLGTVRLFSSADEQRINIYFLDHILNALPETLSGYALK
jgi:hypothetical protein